MRTVPTTIGTTFAQVYLKHRRSCAEQWSRRRLRSTSPSWGSPFGSLYRSRSWRWSDCSPDRPSEKVHPGQPWRPACHKTARTTFPIEEKVLVSNAHAVPVFLGLPTTVVFTSSAFGSFYPSICFQILENKCRTTSGRAPHEPLHTVAVCSAAFTPRECISRTPFLRSALASPTCFHQKKNKKEHTGTFDLSRSWRHRSPVRCRKMKRIYFN